MQDSDGAFISDNSGAGWPSVVRNAGRQPAGVLSPLEYQNGPRAPAMPLVFWSLYSGVACHRFQRGARCGRAIQRL